RGHPPLLLCARRRGARKAIAVGDNPARVTGLEWDDRPDSSESGLFSRQAAGRAVEPRSCSSGVMITRRRVEGVPSIALSSSPIAVSTSRLEPQLKLVSGGNSSGEMG